MKQKRVSCGEGVRISVAAALLLAIISLSTSNGAAQLTTANISGTVTDQSGGAAPGVEVTITNTETGNIRRTTTGPRGRYEAVGLPVGDYEVRAVLTGFQTSVRSGIRLTVGRNAVVDHVLQVGEVTQAVTVTGEVAFVETTTATVSNLVDEQQVEDLPLNNRDLTQLTFLQPGVLRVQQSGDQSGFSGMGDKLTVAGARTTHNLYLLDGVSNGDISGNAQGASSAYSGAETVQEFQIITNNYSAEYQSAAGAIVSAVTKSGTNTLHGSLFEFLRNDNLDAAKWEDNAIGGGVKPEFKRNQFGGSLGGPMIQDRLFFFGSYEGLRERLSFTEIHRIPSEEVHRGFVGGNFIGVTPRVRPYLDLYPIPGVDVPLVEDFGNGSSRIAGPATQPTTDHFVAYKMDYRLNDNHNISGTYNWQDSKRLGPCSPLCQVNGEAGIGVGLLSFRHTVGFKLTSILSPTTVNEFNFGFSQNQPTDDVHLTDLDTSGIRFSDTRPFVGQVDFQSPSIELIGFQGDQATYLQESFTFKNGLTLTRGNHSFRMGGEISRIFTDQRACSDGCTGAFRFGSLEEFLRAEPNRLDMFVADENGRGLSPPHLQTQWVFGSYFQDNWQVRPDLTLNLGLRYEYSSVPGGDEANTAALIHFDDTETTIGPQITQATELSFSPRLGFAWAPGDRKTSIRGGFGVFYIHPRLFHLRTANQLTPPFVQNQRLNTRRGVIRGSDQPLNFPTAFYDGQFALAEALRLLIRVPEYEMQNAYSYRWSFNIQREVGSWILGAGYTGSRAQHLWAQDQVGISKWLIKDSRDANATTVGRWPDNPQPGQYKYFPDPDEPEYIGETVNPAFSSFRLQSPNNNSYYHGLALSAQRRVGSGLQIQLTYNLAKLIDTQSGTTNTGEELNQGQRTIYGFDQQFKRGPSLLDIRNNFVTNFSYELPRFGNGGGVSNIILNGWQLNGILTLSDGAAFAMFDENDAQEDRMEETDGIRPDLIPGGNSNPVSGVGGGCAGIAAGQELGTPEFYFDPCQFVPAPLGFFGNLGKNTLTSPGIATFDWSVFKNFQITETARLQFRAEFFNLFNRPNFHVPTDDQFTFDADSTPDNPIYDSAVRGFAPDGSGSHQISKTRTSARQIQFGLRFTF